jgi:uncharacterized membrane protein SpoIIM required for sporulation
VTVDDFVAAHRPDWQRLEDLLRRMHGGRLRGLSDDDVLAFGHLYRQSTSDLAVARRDYPYDPVTSYLNGLVARAHPFVYRGEAMDVGRLAGFYRVTFPRAFRRTLPFTATAFLLTLVPALVCFCITAVRPDAAYVLLPGVADQLLPIVQHHHLWFNSPSGSQSYVSSFIMTNNIKVALIAFAGGILLGLLSVYILVTNGIMLGTVAGVVQYYGLSLGLWSFIAAHGVIELSVIFISGGCGLQLGWAVLHPGLRTRADACMQAGRTAMVLMLGAVPLLVVAGILEGFLSPSHAPAVLKLGAGLLTGVLLYGYLFTAGRPRRAPRAALAIAV